MFSLAEWNWDHVKTNLVITLFILASGLAKLLFHKAHWLSSRIPESCLLILLGVLFGGLLYGAGFGVAALGVSSHNIGLMYFGNLLCGIGYGCAYTPPIQACLDW